MGRHGRCGHCDEKFLITEATVEDGASASSGESIPVRELIRRMDGREWSGPLEWEFSGSDFDDLYAPYLSGDVWRLAKGVGRLKVELAVRLPEDDESGAPVQQRPMPQATASPAASVLADIGFGVRPAQRHRWRFGRRQETRPAGWWGRPVLRSLSVVDPGIREG
ncbi:hypothetical protein [Haloferula sp. A504]|uniref:hypothetical protein n=1 Tax=Haloferula sp. A504 TaxID=3373601 RepID=UPI0031C3EFC7|nr:hypothetical protein [Verrucomicrobiaceae bacterium E54]